MKPEELEKLFRDKLDVLHTAPPQANWQPETTWGKLESQLLPVAKRKPAFWYAAASVAGLFLLGGYGWYTVDEQRQVIWQLTQELRQANSQRANLPEAPRRIAEQTAQSHPTTPSVPTDNQRIANKRTQTGSVPAEKRNLDKTSLDAPLPLPVDTTDTNQVLARQAVSHDVAPDSVQVTIDPKQLLLTKGQPVNRKKPVFGEVTIVFPGNQPDAWQPPVAVQSKPRQKKSFFRFGRTETEPPAPTTDLPAGFTARLK